ncbi:MAG: heme-binding protein [Acidobacteriaceae bacterium]
MPLPAPMSILAEFQQQLVGTWSNQDFGTDSKGKPAGGPENPLSYNIMPIPQTSDPDGYILKNFKYHERLKFNGTDATTTLAIAADAPNRGGLVSQNCRALFYEQQVMFAEGPGVNTVVHVENGAWLWVPRFVQQDGPYAANVNAEQVQDSLQQPSDVSIAKQISIPHGNSILALGGFDTQAEPGGEGVCRRQPMIKGSPVVPDAPSPYPTPSIAIENPAAPPPPTLISNLNVGARYTTKLINSPGNPTNFQNPHPLLTQCPNRPLQEAVKIIAPESYMHWSVTTEAGQHGKGVVTNIPFERAVSNVTAYFADYWMLFKGKKRYLAYTQTILMVLTIYNRATKRNETYTFPHVTCNTVTFD